MILLAGGISGKTLLLIAGFAILIYGICLGGGKKGSSKNTSKDTSKHYDEREKDPLMHAAKLADQNYAFKGSGRYKDKNGNVHYEKK